MKRGVPRRQTEPTAVVRSRQTEARAEAVTVEWTVQDGEVWKPVTGESLTDAAEPAMSPEAASRAGVGRLPRGTADDAKL